VESYREAAGITDPAQAIGPVPANQAQLREAFHASVVALELPGDQALLRAMGRGQLEAQVSTYQRAEALAPRDVSAELAAADRRCKDDMARAQAAREAGRDAEADTAGILAEETAGELAVLRVADAARREWAEAHASGCQGGRRVSSGRDQAGASQGRGGQGPAETGRGVPRQAASERGRGRSPVRRRGGQG
jgi:hypothetical protein